MLPKEKLLHNLHDLIHERYGPVCLGYGVVLAAGLGDEYDPEINIQ